MEKEITEVYCGNGRGKTTLAIGQALRASSQGKSVIIIQFLKGNERRELDFLEELDMISIVGNLLEELDQLDIKIFRFEKMESCYDQLNEEEQAEEERNILNGLNFARKVIATQECDFLVLDEILGLLDKHIATVDMVVGLLKQKDESMHLILTGNRVDPGILDYVDSVTTITTLGREQNS